MASANNLLADLSRERAALAARTAASTVGIDSGGRHSTSGFIWRAGFVVTSEEGLEGEDNLSIVTADGRRLAATLVGRDASTAVALLKIDDAALAPFAASAVPAVGAIALVSGRGAAGASAHFGTIAVSGPAWRSLQGGNIDAFIRLDVSAGRDKEGGPVVDAEGKLSGMLVFGPRRRALVIPAATIERVASLLLAKGRIPRAYLGLGMRPLRLGPTGERGLIVVSVDPDGPGQKAGVYIGDVVTTWDGEPVGGMRGLMRRLGPDVVGTKVAVGVLRAGANVEVSLEIGERPA
ncbi:MAG TPA: S1C family serine protease [Beijerinckiaceae bacterium]|nr:S1C family serine protease [Beijerinckiaceae bacterium]